MTQGIKYDGDKPRFSLVPPRALFEVVKVLEYGAKKYSPDNWKHVDELHKRYYNAAMRHIHAYRIGECIDQESGFHHLAHAICCLMYIVEVDTINGDGRPID